MFFRKKREKTYKERVTEFWSAFEKVAPRFHAAIEDSRCAELQKETTKLVNTLKPGIGWVFGPGAEGGKHSLTVTGEGDRSKQFLSRYWAELAPEIPGWDFFPARQPSSSIAGYSIDIAENNFGCGDMWLVPEIDEEREVVHVTIWHPLFDKVEKELSQTVLFILLDEALGEWGTESWLGAIEVADAAHHDAIPLAELPELIKTLETERGWKKFPLTRPTLYIKCPRQRQILCGPMRMWEVPPICHS